MTSCNRVVLTGRVVTSPRRSYRPDGIPVIQFPLELNETRDRPVKEKTWGDKRPPLNRTGSGNLINIVAFGKLAEFEFSLLQGGQHLRVEGELKQRHWQTPEGKNRTRTEVIATDLRTLEEANQTLDLHERGEEG